MFVPFTILCRWILLEVLDKVSPSSVNWKHASKPPIKMPFRKVENCNQVIKIGKQLKFSLVNVAGNDIVQGNKKLILGNHYPRAHVSLSLIQKHDRLALQTGDLYGCVSQVSYGS